MDPRYERVLSLLWRVAESYTYRCPAGTVGEHEQRERMDRPKPGDFVIVQMGMAREDWSMGTLVAIDPPGDRHDRHEYRRVWTIDCLDGERRAWSNCRVTALPVGSPFEFRNIDGQFVDKDAPNPAMVRLTSDPEPYDVEQIYDEQISPLMVQILDICKSNDLPVMASFAYGWNPEDGHQVCTSFIETEGRRVPEFGIAFRTIRRAGPGVVAMTITTKPESGAGEAP